MKLLISLIFSIGLFAQTGIPYYNNGVLTYLKPIGGLVVDTTRKQIRTAINGGLRGTPNQLWSVNANGDGEAIDVDWNVFALLPPGTNGKRKLTIVPPPQGIRFIGTKEDFNLGVSSWITYNPSGTINYIQLNPTQVSDREIKLTKETVNKDIIWLYQDAYFRVRDRDYTLTYDSEYAIIKFTDLINIKVGDGITIIAIK
jgi:hypothetical protein